MSGTANLSCPHCKGDVAVSVNSFIDEAETFDLTARAMGQMIDAVSVADVLRGGAESLERYGQRLGVDGAAILVGCEVEGPLFRARLLLSRKLRPTPPDQGAESAEPDVEPSTDGTDELTDYPRDVAFLPQLARVIEKWYGERCGEHEPDCVVCQLWKAYDILSSFEE